MKLAILFPALAAAVLSLSTSAFASPTTAAPASATSAVARAPNGRFATVATTLTAHPRQILVTGAKPIPMGAMMISGGTLVRLPTRYGQEPGPARFVTPLRTWQGAPVKQTVQLARDGKIFQYVPTKGPTLAHR